jgi:hypothetical protein
MVHREDETGAHETGASGLRASREAGRGVPPRRPSVRLSLETSRWTPARRPSFTCLGDRTTPTRQRDACRRLCGLFALSWPLVLALHPLWQPTLSGRQLTKARNGRVEGPPRAVPGHSGRLRPRGRSPRAMKRVQAKFLSCGGKVVGPLVEWSDEVWLVDSRKLEGYRDPDVAMCIVSTEGRSGAYSSTSCASRARMVRQDMLNRDPGRGGRRLHEGVSRALNGVKSISSDHRPWPVPSRPWVMTMRWRDLAFFHWPVEPSLLAPLLPPGLVLATFEGWAWAGVTPFRMEGVRPRALPPVSTLSAFPELNVRTYVT